MICALNARVFDIHVYVAGIERKLDNPVYSYNEGVVGAKMREDIKIYLIEINLCFN